MVSVYRMTGWTYSGYYQQCFTEQLGRPTVNTVNGQCFTEQLDGPIVDASKWSFNPRSDQ